MMTDLSMNKNVVFIGQGLLRGDRIYGTLNDVPVNKCLEMPIAENLIMGAAIGLSLRGFLPVVIFQRIDFMTIASDAIINHLAIMPKMSGGQLKIPMIIRTCLGAQNSKFYVGMQHNKNLIHMFSPHIKTVEVKTPQEVSNEYTNAAASTEPTLIVEHKDLYG